MTRWNTSRANSRRNASSDPLGAAAACCTSSRRPKARSTANGKSLSSLGDRRSPAAGEVRAAVVQGVDSTGRDGVEQVCLRLPVLHKSGDTRFAVYANLNRRPKYAADVAPEVDALHDLQSRLDSVRAPPRSLQDALKRMPQCSSLSKSVRACRASRTSPRTGPRSAAAGGF